MNDKKREEFVQSIFDYVCENERYELWSKNEAIESTLILLVNDIGVAQCFINAIGLKADLYDDLW